MSAHQFREDGSHYNGGAAFFGYGYEAIGEPRLHMVRKWFRQGERRGKTEDSFSVDGQPVDSYDGALAALAVPVRFTDVELEALSLIGDEPADYREAISYDVRHTLRRKGAIAYGPPGRCARTDVGRAALSSEPRS